MNIDSFYLFVLLVYVEVFLINGWIDAFTSLFKSVGGSIYLGFFLIGS